MFPTVSLHVVDTTRRSLIGARGTDPVLRERRSRRRTSTTNGAARGATTHRRVPVLARRAA
jgi:hypothetical protein